MAVHENDAQHLLGGTLHGAGGEKIGKIGQIYLDDSTGRPEWATVSTGLFGSKESFVPLADARVEGSDATVGYDKDRIKGAPHVDPDSGHLSESEEEELYAYYGLARGQVRTDPSVGTRTAETGALGYDAPGAVGHDTSGAVSRGTSGAVGHDTSGPTTDDAMTRSKEQLRAGVETVVAGKARLRKYVTTETDTVTVPVRRETAHLVTEPITDANAGRALSGPGISEEEHEVVLHEERAVVTTETVPIERVRLETTTETVNQNVSGQVREEHIELEDETSVTGTTRDTTTRGTTDRS